MQLVKYNVMMYINMLEPTRHTGDAPDPCRTGGHKLRFRILAEIWYIHTIPYRDLYTAAGPEDSGSQTLGWFPTDFSLRIDLCGRQMTGECFLELSYATS